MNEKNVQLALFALATTFFGIGITEFIGVGVLPEISEAFDVSTSTAGLIVSLYAVGVAIGGVILTSLTSQMARKKNIDRVDSFIHRWTYCDGDSNYIRNFIDEPSCISVCILTFLFISVNDRCEFS